jgi:hypothetical protein
LSVLGFPITRSRAITRSTDLRLPLPWTLN